MSTQQIVEAALDRRDNGIRREFRNVDERLERLEIKVDEQSRQVDERFLKVDERFNEVDERFNKVDERFNKVDERFNKVDERFNKVDEQISQLHDQMNQLHNQMNQFMRLSTAQSTNPRAARARDKVLPVPIFSASSPSQLSFPSPKHFPSNVHQFWDLRKKVDKLTYLCHFYNITGEEIAGNVSPQSECSDTDEEDDDNSSSRSQAMPRLREMVVDHTMKALSCLAGPLLLDYERISYNMEIITDLKKIGAQREEKGVKRGAASEETSSNSDKLPDRRKRLTTDPPARVAGQGHEDRAAAHTTKQSLLPEIPWADYVAEPRDPSTPSEKSHVRWASHSTSPGKRRFLKDCWPYSEAQAVPDPEARSDTRTDMHEKDAIKQGTQHSSVKSDGSTVPFSQTPLAFKLAAERLKQKGRPGGSN
ncbi:hypothetical protein HRR81_000002 [Exophiala dermatitidis]|uniref:t-SNARE coiled-coil homology domain-containing protein n=1 Tax=Exophiala dermatitidis (strain ATCC 34100 / CBS 525.76 / NIH/UT8656) TaxID=858893 RepID=H6CBT7_EXODN|nr:uncharacterized protein HMPREF1120_09170 [Exophiala dermatitidis NIH/UT8656]KAJ4525315.1 hypothetical protein HRR75_000906 [Exophiala dermatitidis]EHY61234.1 hypothetical protein HMPREF1120_09170 [Exophiala dermatitidis NIH/UT8656]KAJ4530267.1 hypothetical protein HRR76_009495 [Exophiala dermatitidis]KAJ4559033.1 hypothetical protein HRR77_000997 [Exophiala dermatitidis]KAJ4584196.1 hypothetical protein HRR81_000002 [Exophiala dermatitidis]